MKRMIRIAGLTVAATLGLVSCNIISPVEEAAELFTVRVSNDQTKTTNNRERTLWAKDDQISVLYAPAGTPATEAFTNLKMTLSSGEGTSDAEFTTAATISGINDFYAIYPYSDKYMIPGQGSTTYTYVGHKDGVNQSGYDSMSHLCGNVCPLYAVAKNVDGETVPSFSMKHLESVMKLNIHNLSDKDFILTRAEVEASESIVGSFYIDFSAETPAFTATGAKYVNNTAVVNVSDGDAIGYAGFKLLTQQNPDLLIV